MSQTSLITGANRGIGLALTHPSSPAAATPTMPTACTSSLKCTQPWPSTSWM